MATTTDIRSQAIEAVIAKHPEKKLADLSILDVMPEFHNGSLYVVGWTGPEGKKWQDYAFLHEGEWDVFINDDDLIKYIGRTSHAQSLAVRVLRFAGISGLIALIITVTICILAIQNISIPGVLSNALTIILGFYFATVVYEAKRGGA